MEEEGSDITDDLVDGCSEKHATEVENPKQVKPLWRLEMSTSRTIILSSVPGDFLNSHCSNCFELLSNDRFQCGLCNGGDSSFALLAWTARVWGVGADLLTINQSI